MGEQDAADEMVAIRARTEREAFDILIERYEEPLKRYCRRLARMNTEETEDILQEAFLNMYKYIASFDEAYTFQSWAYRITHNTTMSWLRKHRKLVNTPTSLDYETEDGLKLLETLAGEDDVHEHVCTKEEGRYVREMLNKLPQKEKDVLILKYLEEKTYEEIGDILRKPSGTIGTLLHRGKKRLKTILEKQGTYNRNKI